MNVSINIADTPGSGNSTSLSTTDGVAAAGAPADHHDHHDHHDDEVNAIDAGGPAADLVREVETALAGPTSDDQSLASFPFDAYDALDAGAPG